MLYLIYISIFQLRITRELKIDGHLQPQHSNKYYHITRFNSRKNSLKAVQITVENRRSSTAPTFKQILPHHKIQQSQKFLESSANKQSLIKFLTSE